MLKQRLATEGERIVKIVGAAILPRVHHLAPNFPFPCLFECFGDTQEGKDAPDAARAAMTHVITDLKRRVIWALPKS
jgi:hypothetical protein